MAWQGGFLICWKSLSLSGTQTPGGSCPADACLARGSLCFFSLLSAFPSPSPALFEHPPLPLSISLWMVKVRLLCKRWALVPKTCWAAFGPWEAVELEGRLGEAQQRGPGSGPPVPGLHLEREGVSLESRRPGCVSQCLVLVSLWADFAVFMPQSQARFLVSS